MANSELRGGKILIDDDINYHLKRIYNAYNGPKDVEGYERLRGLCDNNNVSYEQLKRIKNFFDGYEGKNNETTYLLNGGTKMREWVKSKLDDMRNNISSKKKNMKNVGMPNQYQKDKISIGNVKIDTHDSDTNKILRQEGIYSIKVLDDLITEINKNKKLWHIL
tara:strand:- start:3112 stop:3603 length:492 start_codon:yes stop_codon:yes gene_type:complete